MHTYVHTQDICCVSDGFILSLVFDYCADDGIILSLIFDD